MLGQVTLQLREKPDTSKNMDDFLAAFATPAAIQQQEEQMETVVIELWDSNRDIFEIYRLLQNFFGEYYTLSDILLIKLVEKRNMDIEEALYYIPYIHSTYVQIVLPTSTTSTT